MTCLSLIWSYNFLYESLWCVDDGEQLGYGANSSKGGRLCSHLSIVRLRARNMFFRVVLHCVDIGLMKTIRVFMMLGV